MLLKRTVIALDIFGGKLDLVFNGFAFPCKFRFSGIDEESHLSDSSSLFGIAPLSFGSSLRSNGMLLVIIT